MQPPGRKIDSVMRSYTRTWMKSFDKPRASTTLGYFFVGLFILIWSSSLTLLLGFNIKNGYGALIFIGIGLVLSFMTIFMNKVMLKIGLERSIRSALLLSALVGPFVNHAIYNSSNEPVVSHIAGFFASIITFMLSYLLDTKL